MKRRVAFLSLTVLFVVITSFLVAPHVLADTEPLTIKTMKVSIWPEYDDSRVLVIYQGEFSDAAAFPQPVEFPVPPGSEMSQVCALQPPNNEHLCQLYETRSETNGLSVAYTLPIPTYYLEYYWDGINRQEGKSISFQYTSPYAVDTLEVEVQQPARATQFELAEPYTSQATDSLGMKYYRYVFNDVTPGQVVNIDASYSKPDDNPSVSGTQAGGAAGGDNTYTWVGIIAAMAVVAIGIILFRRRPVVVNRAQARRANRIEARRAEASNVREARAQAIRAEPKVNRQPSRASKESGQPAMPAGEVNFCSYCGKKLAPGAAFCHACGADMKDIPR